MWVAGKTVIPLTRAIPERIRGSYDDALYKSTFTLLYFTMTDKGATSAEASSYTG